MRKVFSFHPVLLFFVSKRQTEHFEGAVELIDCLWPDAMELLDLVLIDISELFQRELLPVLVSVPDLD